MTALTARARARAQVTREILEAARVHLARDGAAALSLRAVARDLGMVSSAIYRYVPNRDTLLTLLIVDAYNALGLAAERADATCPRAEVLARFLAIGGAVRGWALEHPHEYALIYGSPVPGYAAPEETIPPASRVPALLLALLADLTKHGGGPSLAPVPTAVTEGIGPLRALANGGVSDGLLTRGLAAWATLLGLLSLELFGHLTNVVENDSAARAAFFEHQLRAIAANLGLTRD